MQDSNVIHELAFMFADHIFQNFNAMLIFPPKFHPTYPQFQWTTLWPLRGQSLDGFSIMVCPHFIHN